MNTVWGRRLRPEEKSKRQDANRVMVNGARDGLQPINKPHSVSLVFRPGGEPVVCSKRKGRAAVWTVSTVNYAARCRNKFQNFFASTCILFSRPLNNKLFSRAAREIYRADTGPINISPSVRSLTLCLSLASSSRSIRRDSNYCRATHSTLLSRRRLKDFQLITNLAAKLSFTLLPFERNSL